MLVEVIAVKDPNRTKGEKFECTKEQAEVLVGAGYCEYADKKATKTKAETTKEA